MATPKPIPVALACLLLVQPATAAADTAACQATTAQRLQRLAHQAGDCLLACHHDAATDPSRRCDTDAPDDTLARCLSHARAKADKRIRRACAGDACPACYAGADCPRFVEGAAATTLQAVDRYFDALYCDDGASVDGLTDAESRCRASAWVDVQRLTRRVLRCRNAADPHGCSERAAARATTALRRSCGDAAPECSGLDRASVSAVVRTTTGMLAPWTDALFCAAACGDGTVGAGEECDPRAVPTGCAREQCDACRCLAICGDGAWNGHEQCDGSAPATDAAARRGSPAPPACSAVRAAATESSRATSTARRCASCPRSGARRASRASNAPPAGRRPATPRAPRRTSRRAPMRSRIAGPSRSTRAPW